MKKEKLERENKLPLSFPVTDRVKQMLQLTTYDFDYGEEPVRVATVWTANGNNIVMVIGVFECERNSKNEKMKMSIFRVLVEFQRLRYDSCHDFLSEN